MKRDLPEKVDTTGLEDTPAFKYLRLPNLFQEYFRLKEIGATTTESKQRKKNAQQQAVVKEAIGKSGPEALKILNSLETNPQDINGFLQAANKEGREAHAAEVQRRTEAAKGKRQATEIEVNELTDKILKAINSGKFADFVDAALGLKTRKIKLF